ncbi:S-methyl-5-thioribose-1-phosphate isomerase [Actinomadura logoneensis]|uniref:Methylthioribose-1-phosphate isomerase n=1 Tax=Actinomadura logoneensis TaxID=2293572 RepID=A0A372JDY3_9ACTN|nr:S-methyl-5-thioribose-1-phosphate isomerase [Actinomadura logoneensis]RFU38180.1 S-methyl-5-thioribose-1-phosphate isomerase [Actinomadura logoneensis]
MTPDIAPIAWTGDSLRLIDQTLLPARLEYRDVADVDDLVDAIKRLVVRGAPALGVAGALGVVVALRQADRESWDATTRDAAIARIREARPTAVNLAAGVDRVRPLVDEGADAVLAEALAFLDEDVRGNRAIGRHGAAWLTARTGDRPLRLLTHCNAGALATAGWGTALGVVRELHARDRVETVYADETRPLLQGSRLTAWELEQMGVPYYVQPDGAAAGTILGGHVDAAIVGADRVAANGDTANKVGTLAVALACAAAGIPFLVAAPWSTVDLATPDGARIPIEQRAPAEILANGGTPVAPPGARAHNPAFDVTPARLVTALITETGVLEPARGRTPAEEAAEKRERGR